ncbi:MAG TPA: efflux RND transporter periplasmic adaptor subunit [Anaerolineales bacterium]|jgi:macrolide-specific efflux system membrane fusion protein
MKMRPLIIALLLALALDSCSAAPTPAALPTLVLDSSPGTDRPSGATVTASGQVIPASKVNLSFPLIGAVKTIDVQVGDTVTTGDTLITLDTLILEARVAEAEAGVASAETEVRYLRRVGPGAEQLLAAQAEVERAVAAVEQAKAILNQAALKTPIGGTVVAINVAPGETVVPGQVAIIVGDLTDMRVETTDLSERDVPALRIGQSATVFVSALDRELTGKVADIARAAETIGGDVVYKVTIELDEQPTELRWGMSAEVTIQAEQQ